MAIFEVPVTRPRTETALIQVEAPNRSYAVERALMLAHPINGFCNALDWELDDHSTGEVYCPDESAIQEVRP